MSVVKKHFAYPTMKSRKSTYCLLGLLSVSATVALAQEGDRPSPPAGGGGGGRLAEFLKRADTNGDGKISKEEFGAVSRGDGGDERFAKMDANSDGFVDEAEMASIAEKMRDGMRNRKGGEGGPGGMRRPGGEGSEGGFRRPPGEGSEGAAKPSEERPAPPEGERRPEGGPPRGPGGPGGMPNMDEVFGRMDKNSDGIVDKDEYVAFSQEEIETRFSRADGNEDGKLTKEELQSGMERMRNMMRGQGGPGGRGPGGEGRGPGAEGGGRRGPEGAEGGRGEGGFRRPPSQEGDKGSPRPEFETEAPKKDPA